MSRATPTLKPTLDVTKPDTADWTRATWRAAYRQSRSMIRAGERHGLGARYVWALGHLRRRFGPTGWPVAQAAARVAFDLRAVSKAATGTREQLAREGMLTRCVRLEPAPRGPWFWAWTFDDLGSPNTARSLRRYQAKRRREVAAVLAEDRLAMTEERFVITPAGLAALREAEVARATA
jgi:hypothetical protein